LKKGLEQARIEAEAAEARVDLAKAAEIRYGRIPQMEKDLSAKEVKEALDEKGVIPQLFYITSPEYKMDYLGLGKVNDESTYRLKVVMPSGRTSVQEYSSKTGLLLKEETTTAQENADVPITIEYKNYIKSGAVLLPSEVTRTVGGQEIPFKYKEIKINEGVSDADFI
jgi:hypothetical protein